MTTLRALPMAPPPAHPVYVRLRAGLWPLQVLGTGEDLADGACPLYREYRDEQRFDRAPILVLDRTEYIYAPAPGKQCVSANEAAIDPGRRSAR